MLYFSGFMNLKFIHKPFEKYKVSYFFNSGSHLSPLFELICGKIPIAIGKPMHKLATTRLKSKIDLILGLFSDLLIIPNLQSKIV